MTLDKMTPEQLDSAKEFYETLETGSLSRAGHIRANFSLRMITAEQRRRKMRVPAFA